MASLQIKPHVVSLGIAIAVVVTTALVSYQDWNEYRDFTRVEEQSDTAIDRVQDLLSLLKDAETGQRGYLLTGDNAYLAPYLEALPRIEVLLRELGRQPPDLAARQAANAMPRLIGAKLGELAQTIQVRRSGDTAGALAILRTNIGKQTMDEIRVVANQWIKAERDQFGVRQSIARAHSSRAKLVILLGAGILTLLLFGATLQVNKLFNDVEQSRMQEQTQRETLTTTLRSIGDAVITTDELGVVTFLNPVAEQLTGWSASQAMGRPLAAVFHIIGEATRQPVDNPAAKVLREGVIVGLANHTLLLTKDGREVPIDDSGAPVRNRSGRTAGVVLVFRDVTERRLAQRALEDSERRYRLLFESNPGAMWVYDHETLQFLAVNNAAMQRYGYTREEFLGMTLKDIRPLEDVPKLLEVTSVPTASLHTEGPWRHRKRDGTVITVEITEHPLTFDGRSASLVMANDITDRKRLEEQFYQSQRIESIGRLAGGVAHDFNNLLTVINSYSEMLLADAPEHDPARESLNEIRLAGERAAALTQQLLAFSRQQIVQPTVLNVNLIVADVQKMLQRLIGEDIELVTKLEPALGNIKADAGQLQQVIMNLAINARDAMPRGGSLIIETANVVFDETYVAAHSGTQSGPHIMLAVTDTGTGMSKEVKEKLFEPFFTTKPKGSGTGLGLATVHGMVRQSGGWIWVYSEPGDGATFKIYFPRTGSPLPAVRLPLRSDTQGNETILVVEDQDEVRHLAVRALTKYGYIVYAAANGNEALSFCKQFKETIHLLLTDIIMPGINGYELVDKLAGERPGLKVLFMSGYTENAFARRSELEPEICYLQKPFTPESLASKVREALAPRTARATILIVDDDESIVRLFQRLLANAGYATIEAANGRQALAKLAGAVRVDLVITDLVMPEQEGLDLIRAIQAQRPRIKVIAMSGAFGGGYLRVAELLGAVASLRKPVKTEELLQAVREALKDITGATG